jgi:hypothetical protein
VTAGGMEINDAIVAILHGKPYTLPKMPIADKLYERIRNEGIEKGITFYDSLKNKGSSEFRFWRATIKFVRLQATQRGKKQGSN